MRPERLDELTKFTRVQPRLLLFLCATILLLNCDGTDNGGSSNRGGVLDGGDAIGGGESAPTVENINLTWSTWGPDGQPLPDSISCNVSGGTPETVTASMGGDGLDPITYTLADDGSNGDDTAGDGVYTIEFIQDLGENALWAVDNIGHYLTCDAQNADGSDSMTWTTAGEVLLVNETGSTYDVFNISRATSSGWGPDFINGILNNGNTFTVTDVPCGVYDLRACSSGTCVSTMGIVLKCGGTHTWTITP